MILVLATENKDKGKEIASIINKQIDVSLRFLTDFSGLTLPPETGATYRENAILKAKTVAEAVGHVAMGDDSGLEVEALNGAPGLYSARFANGSGFARPSAGCGELENEASRPPHQVVEKASYRDNRKKVLGLLGNLNDEKRRARFVCTVAIADPSGDVEVVEGVCEGQITRFEIGEDGFGYDSIFYLPHLGKTFAECTREEKNRVSHRGIALRAAIEILKKRSFGV